MKRVIPLLLLLCLVISFASCMENNENVDLFEQLLSSSESNAELAEPFADKVYVTVSRSASATLCAKADELAKAISEKTNVETVLKYDNEPLVLLERDLEILVGNTDRLISQEAMKRLKLGDRVCKWDRGKIVLGGRYEDATVAAIDEFISTVLHGASSQCLMGENVRIEHFEKYDVAALTLNGYDLYDFSLVYSDKNGNCEKEIARVLRDYIAAKSGYFLEMIPDTAVNDSTGKIISVGCSFASENSVSLYDAFIEPSAQGVSIGGKGSYALSAAAYEFVKGLLEGASSESAGLVISQTVALYPKASELNICSAFIAATEYGEEYSNNVLLTLRSKVSSHDVVIFQSVDSQIMDYHVLLNIPTGYAVSKAENNDAVVIYREGIFESLECTFLEGFVDVSARLAADAGEYRIAHARSDSQALKALADGAAEYDALVLDGKENALPSQLKLAGGGQCSLGGTQYSRDFYMNENFTSLSVTNDGFNGTQSVSLFSSVEVGEKYTRDFLELTKALK